MMINFKYTISFEIQYGVTFMKSRVNKIFEYMTKGYLLPNLSNTFYLRYVRFVPLSLLFPGIINNLAEIHTAGYAKLINSSRLDYYSLY